MFDRIVNFKTNSDTYYIYIINIHITRYYINIFVGNPKFYKKTTFC